MRRILTNGVKAILAIAALSTAAHWAMRLQREPAGPALPVALAVPSEPTVTGALAPQRRVPKVDVASADPAAGLDQRHLLKLIASASGGAKLQKAVASR